MMSAPGTGCGNFVSGQRNNQNPSGLPEREEGVNLRITFVGNEPAPSCRAHRILAVRRGESEVTSCSFSDSQSRPEEEALSIVRLAVGLRNSPCAARVKVPPRLVIDGLWAPINGN